MTPLVFEASDQLIPIVFEVDKTLGQYLSTASSTIYNIGISLMILKFLKRALKYTLWEQTEIRIWTRYSL